MKRLIALILTFVIALSLCACGGSGEGNASAGLQVGYAREKIHPEESVPLAGYGQTEKRMSQNALDLLQATCVAFKEGNNTILLFSQDLIRSTSTWVEEVRTQLNQKLGIPKENIMVSATHTHSAPDSTKNLPSIQNYRVLYVKQMVKAGEKAVADLAPATLYGAKTDADLNYIRHYKMADGTFAGSNFGSWSSGIVDHARENDPGMQVIKIDREGDKKDIMMVNWQAHPCNTGGVDKLDISADYIAPFRDKIEADTGMHFIYFLGASGDHNATSKMDDHHGLEHKEYGQKLAQYAIDALPNLQPIEGTGIQNTQLIYEGPVNHDDEHLQAEAQQVKAAYEAGGRDAGNKVARQLGISSVYHANAILARPNRPATTTMEINTLRVGNLAFITAPIEMFAAHGKYIKDNSPFEFTFICTCSNDAKGYIPTIDAYEYGCYESYTSTFAKGVGEALAEKYVEMLKGLQ